MAIPGYGMKTAAEFVGQELGVSGWQLIDQGRINAFADCTGDHQFATPVKAGSRIRMRVALLSVEDRGKGRLLLGTRNTSEIGGEEKPALTAESLALVW